MDNQQPKIQKGLIMNNELLRKYPKDGYGFIYCYTSPSNKKYIGQTIRTLALRAGKDGIGYQSCSYFYRAIQKYGFSNFQVEILEEIPLERLNEREKYWIQKYQTQELEYGYNLKPGGVIQNFQTRENFKSKHKVLQYDLQGNFIREYESLSQAAKEQGIIYQAISQCCRDEIEYYKDSIWRYAEDTRPVLPVIPSKTHGRKTAQYSLEGELIMIYPSANAAAVAIGKPPTAGRNIRAVCEGKRKTTFGYKWAFLD